MNIELMEKLWSRTEFTHDGHWLWRGPVNTGGYGTVSIGGRLVVISRYSLVLYCGELYDGNWVACHICKYRNCWCPIHLYVGTYSDNNTDTVLEGKHRKAGWTHCTNGHEFTPENTYRKPNGTRVCRKCSYKTRRNRIERGRDASKLEL